MFNRHPCVAEVQDTTAVSQAGACKALLKHSTAQHNSSTANQSNSTAESNRGCLRELRGSSTQKPAVTRNLSWQQHKVASVHNS